jgi:hypothetical protein
MFSLTWTKATDKKCRGVDGPVAEGKEMIAE